MTDHRPQTSDIRPQTDGTIDAARNSLTDALRLSFNILKVIMAVVLILFLTSGIFVVEQHEAGIVFRFGRIVGKPGQRVLEPGLHWAWPFPIDEHITIPAARVHSTEVSFTAGDTERTLEGRKTIPGKLRPGFDKYCLTGDANIVHSRWVIRYRIVNPEAYVIGAEEPERVLRVLTESAVIRETSRFGVDEALRTNVDELRRRVQKTIESGLQRTDIGIVIEGVDLRTLPPAQVKDAFNSVIRAEQERSRRINEALAFQNRIVNQVKGESARIVSNAKTYNIKVVEQASADSEYLKSLLREYPGEPEKLTVYLNQLYQEVIGEVLAGVEERFIIAKGESAADREIRIIIGPQK